MSSARVEYKTQTTVPLADGPLAAALWGRAMNCEGRSGGEGIEAIDAYCGLPKCGRKRMSSKIYTQSEAPGVCGV